MADNDSKLSLDNAKWFAQQLGNFSPGEQSILLKTEDFGEFEKILFKKQVFNSIGLWQGRIDWQNHAMQGINIPISPGETEKVGNKPQGLSTGGAGTTLAGLGMLATTRPEKYEDFKKRSTEYAENAAGNWEKEEEKFKKNPPKKIDPNRPTNKQEAHNRAMADYHDMLIRGDAKKAKKWATEQNDLDINAAFERKKLADEAAAQKKTIKTGRISRTLRRQPVPPPTKEATPIQIAPKGQALRGRVKSLGTKVKKKLLDASHYLQLLFKKSFKGSIAGAIGGVVSSIVGTMTTAVATIGAVAFTTVALILTKVASVAGTVAGAVGSAVATIGIPGIVVLAFFLILIVVFSIVGFFFPPPEIGKPISQSPYPGIAYSIACSSCTQRVVNGEIISYTPNGQNITYEIILVHDSNVSKIPIENITLVATVPDSTIFVKNQTTGIFSGSASSNNIKWKLSDNQPTSQSDGATSYRFTLVLDPDDNATFEISIYLEGPGLGGGGPPRVGGDCGGKYTSRNSPQGNFGDPGCDFTKDGFGQTLKDIDPKNADFWYLLAECESTVRPNAYFRCNADRTVCTPRKTGAWGLFQMGIEKPNLPTTYVGGQGPWREQVQGAYNRETKVAETPLYNNPFDYWQCEANACQGVKQLCTNGEYNVQGRTW